MKVSKSFIFTCDCGHEYEVSEEHVGVERLLGHIKQKHPLIFTRLEKEGRKAAMSQNGCGYHDSGEGKYGGWHEAQASFRNAWIKNVLSLHI
jgi:hypothetical protein